jgi:DnaJ-domain-containing protein 1
MPEDFILGRVVLRDKSQAEIETLRRRVLGLWSEYVNCRDYMDVDPEEFMEHLEQQGFEISMEPVQFVTLQ